MKHEKALAIRTITEAMTNAYNLNDNELVAKLKQELLNSLQADKGQPPFVVEGGQVFINEKVAESLATVEEPALPTLGEQVVALIGDGCPHCFIVNVIVNNREFPMGDEDFCYGLSDASSFSVFADIMRTVADSLQEHVEQHGPTGFAKRFADFTTASIAAHKRLQDDGKAPQLDPVKQLVADMMADIIKIKAARLQ